MSKQFIKKKEDFVCENCGRKVKGNGYTNHCPFCLFGKHVDIYPGDRKEICGGLMKPEGLIVKKGKYSIIHKCILCTRVRNNVMARDDNMDLALSIERVAKFHGE